MDDKTISETSSSIFLKSRRMISTKINLMFDFFTGNERDIVSGEKQKSIDL